MLSGQGCDDYYSFLQAGNNTYNNFFDYCIQIAGKGHFHLTRFDIAIDDKNNIPYFTVEQIKHKCLKDEFVSKSKSYRFSENSFNDELLSDGKVVYQYERQDQ